MIKTAMPLIIYVLTLAVIICSVIVVATFEPNKLLGYLPILIAVYCTTATLSRAYNMYLKDKEPK